MKPIDSDRLRSHVKTDATRQERLAAELRRNLKRRKEHSRMAETKAEGMTSSDDAPASGGDSRS
jgi:hypothetical protein